MFAAQHLSYRNTASFSKIVLDYIDKAESLSPFYSFAPDITGIKNAIEQKKNQKIHRNVLVDVLKEQYKIAAQNNLVAENIEALLSDETFTVCTAHQPNLFTGPLYFIYKILHAIKLAGTLAKEFPNCRFVPVYYMGSEDADLEELNHFSVEGKKYEWATEQKGAVGRMFVDKGVIALIDELQGQIGNTKNGVEFVQMLREYFITGSTIQQCTFSLVNGLFGKYGLIVLIPDDARLKRQMISIFEDDLFKETSSITVQQTSNRLNELYRTQAHARDINLFYLKDDVRERIEKKDERFIVLNSTISFTEAEIRQELIEHPERFSPNVILRGLFQETILPNIVFIGGGGELAYWLQLKDLFVHYKIDFPVLVLRNSFLLIEKRWSELMQKLQLSVEQIFETELNILNGIIETEGNAPKLNGELRQMNLVYEGLKKVATGVDVSLLKHIEALKARSVNQLAEVEKKMMRAERKKLEATKAQLQKLKAHLFPRENLQERVENVSGFYAKWGSGFIDELLEHSLSLEQRFVVLKG